MRSILAGLWALLLAGCPLPQSIPESVGNGSPGLRIIFELMTPRTTFIDVAKNCVAPPAFTLRGTLSDVDLTEQVEARWFEDYDPVSPNNRLLRPPNVLDGDGIAELRQVPDFVYRLASDFTGPVYGVHVVEVVVSSGFDQRPDQGALALPNRTPQAGRTTQSFRWVFRYVDSGGACSG